MGHDRDDVLVTAAADASAVVASWYEAHAEIVFRYVARRLGSEIARDVVADVFRAAIEGFESYEASRGSERSWLLGIATNLVRRHWRTEQRRLRAIERLAHVRVDESAECSDRVHERVDASRQMARLMDAVENLPAEDRDLLVLVAWERCSHAEVGEILAIPTGTVGSRLNRIRTQLRHREGPCNG